MFKNAFIVLLSLSMAFSAFAAPVPVPVAEITAEVLPRVRLLQSFAVTETVN
jgi:hypothetical protein